LPSIDESLPYRTSAGSVSIDEGVFTRVCGIIQVVYLVWIIPTATNWRHGVSMGTGQQLNIQSTPLVNNNNKWQN